MIQTVQILSPKCHFGVTSNDGRMFLQRRCRTANKEYGNREHDFYVQRNAVGRWEVTFHTPTGDHRDVKYYQEDVELLIAERTGKAMLFQPETVAYMYDGYHADDVIFSPLRYEVGSDTIRHVPTNIAVTAFQGGRFAEPILDVDRAAEPYLQAARRALQRGFSSCDEQRGDDYCKRRLAWLAGQYLMDDPAVTQLQVAVLAHDMASGRRLGVPAAIA